MGNGGRGDGGDERDRRHEPDVLGLDEIDPAAIRLVGGKAANLAALSRLDGVRVPPGFCVTTAAFGRALDSSRDVAAAVALLATLDPDDHEAGRTASADARIAIEQLPIPDELATAIRRAAAQLGAPAWAVRSSATAEDLGTASFAGQFDTYLHVDTDAIVEHVRRCWASLFTARAMSYRTGDAVAGRRAAMAVVVQAMVAADAAGVMFTADPLTGDRRVTTIEATVGLADSMISGRSGTDVYRLRDGRIVRRDHRSRPVLRDDQIHRLEATGRAVEAHLGSPQDVEWCLAADVVHVVQARPITTSFPVPPVDDDRTHVYVSVGHQQMMTDAMTPLGLSIWKASALRPMVDAGSRLFVDVTDALAAPASRTTVLDALGASDPLIRDALQTLLDRGDVVVEVPDHPHAPPPAGGASPAMPTDPAIITSLMARTEASVARLAAELAPLRGVERLDAVAADFAELRRQLADPESTQAIIAGFDAARWLDDHLREWLGEHGTVDVLTQSVPNNVTAEMGLALLDVADAVRRSPEVVAHLRDLLPHGAPDAHEAPDTPDAPVDLAERLGALPGGGAAGDALAAFLDRYGMRCPGEIDITRPRWSERPIALVPMILANVDQFEPGEARRRVDRGRVAAQRLSDELTDRLRQLPDGEGKATEVVAMIDRLRTFAGYREFPKYGMIARYAVYRSAITAEADRLARAGVLREAADGSFLTFDELREVVATGHADDDLIADRRAAFEAHRALTTPRVLTSDGECLSGSYRRTGLPSAALVGLAVSGGVVEGRARVVTDLADASFAAGDILVTRFTDPSWTPAFLTVAGLVTEVGGLMTHGAVIAREYGLPAVVNVEGATSRIADGQRVRVDGTQGYVDVLAT